jgi:hypothetical protein
MFHVQDMVEGVDQIENITEKSTNMLLETEGERFWRQLIPAHQSSRVFSSMLLNWTLNMINLKES